MPPSALPQQTNATYNALIQAVNSGTAPPVGWAPLPGASKQDDTTGLNGQAFYNTTTNQIVIAFEGIGTVGAAAGLPSTPIQQAAAQTDAQIQQGVQPVAFQNAAAAFVTQVEAAATAQFGSGAQLDIETTGHSLGGYAAQYLAQQNDFGGTSYGGPGLLNGYTIPATGPVTNFVSYSFTGDAIGMMGSQSGVVYPPDTGLFGTPGPYYGVFQSLGPASQQTQLQANLFMLEPDGNSNTENAANFETGLFLLAASTKLTHSAYSGYFLDGLDTPDSSFTSNLPVGTTVSLAGNGQPPVADPDGYYVVQPSGSLAPANPNVPVTQEYLAPQQIGSSGSSGSTSDPVTISFNNGSGSGTQTATVLGTNGLGYFVAGPAGTAPGFVGSALVSIGAEK